MAGSTLMWRVDLHVHTTYSRDSKTSLDKVIAACVKNRLDAIAIADHNTIEGALKLKNSAPKNLIIIVGEEVSTASGEIIGLFLSEPVEPGLSAEETIGRIRDQNGLIIIPHPFDRYRKSCINKKVLAEIGSRIDGVETFNSRNLDEEADKFATDFARQFSLASTAGSDAHLASEIGNAYMEIMPFDSPASFLSNLRAARIAGKRSGITPHFVTKVIKLTHFLCL